MTSYLFIDGAYLQEHFARLMHGFYGVVPQIVYATLAGHLGGQRTYYYDAINYQRAGDETEEACEARIAKIQAYHAHISSQTGYHVREGRVRKSAQRRKQEQKGVDVQLAVDAMEHAARRNMQRAIVFTGDLDFEPLLTSLVSLGIHTKLVYVPRFASQELRSAADEIQKVTLEHFHAWTPPSFRQERSQVFLRYREPAPTPSVYEPVRQGRWHGRSVTLYRANDSSSGRLYVAPGDELSEPSYTMGYPITDDLPKAFELTFGEVEWNALGTGEGIAAVRS